MAVVEKTEVKQLARREWRQPLLHTQQLVVPTNLLFCSQFCCDIDGALECVASPGVCSGNGGTPALGC